MCGIHTIHCVCEATTSCVCWIVASIRTDYIYAAKCIVSLFQWNYYLFTNSIALIWNMTSIHNFIELSWPFFPLSTLHLLFSSLQFPIFFSSLTIFRSFPPQTLLFYFCEFHSVMFCSIPFTFSIFCSFWRSENPYTKMTWWNYEIYWLCSLTRQMSMFLVKSKQK